MADLPFWQRPYFQEGGGSPFLFYVVYGRFDPDAPLSRSKYRVEGMPDEVDLIHYHRPEHAQACESFLDGYLWDRLKRNDPDLAAAIVGQSECMVLRAEFSDPPNLNYFRDSLGIVTWLLDQGGVGIYDPQMFKWWSPADWKENAFEPATPLPRQHTVILFSEEEHGNGKWVHTRGMKKFGRPDLSIHGVTEEWWEAAIELCNRFIEFQAFGGVIEEGREIRMAGTPNELRCYHRGDLDDPEFNNVHVLIGAPGA
jgi:hypothetical protein